MSIPLPLVLYRSPERFTKPTVPAPEAICAVKLSTSCFCGIGEQDRLYRKLIVAVGDNQLIVNRQGQLRGTLDIKLNRVGHSFAHVVVAIHIGLKLALAVLHVAHNGNDVGQHIVL